MAKTGPILLLEDDLDDQEMIREVIAELNINNEIKIFVTASDALDYLLTTTDQPFIIISDINLPLMNGIELRQAINENDYLREKSIPFIFLTTSADKHAINKAYQMIVQGFFIKPNSYASLKETVALFLDYWKVCKHPNS